MTTEIASLRSYQGGNIFDACRCYHGLRFYLFSAKIVHFAKLSLLRQGILLDRDDRDNGDDGNDGDDGDDGNDENDGNVRACTHSLLS